MLTGKALFNTLLTELNDMGLPGMSSTLDEMYRSPDFRNLDPLMAIAMLPKLEMVSIENPYISTNSGYIFVGLSEMSRYLSRYGI